MHASLSLSPCEHLSSLSFQISTYKKRLFSFNLSVCRRKSDLLSKQCASPISPGKLHFPDSVPLKTKAFQNSEKGEREFSTCGH